MNLTPYLLRHQDGTLRKQGQLLDGEKHGEWRTWHSTGKLAAIAHYELGERTGHWQSWYPDGQFKASRFFVAGKEHGRREVHYREKYWIEDFVAGLKHGLWQEWAGERLLIQGEHHEGLKHGEWSFFDEAGELITIKHYKRGKLVSERPSGGD